MNLAMDQDQENRDTQNVVPLGSDDIRSILKSQSESVFEDKNISNNSNFVKKTLIDIALDFESKQNVKESKDNELINNAPENNKNFHIENDVPSDEQNTEEEILDENKDGDNTKDIQAKTEHANNEVDINTNFDTKINEPPEDIQSEKLVKNASHTDIANDTQKQQQEIKADTKADEIIKTDEETQQALDSVRDAVSQSMSNIDDENTITLEKNNELSNNESDTISNDLENFKNILSSLPTLAEEAIYEIFENKILEISYDLAGYQIDKMPEKYEKKIKSFLKNINCYQDKITVEINDKDFEALSKIKNFNENEDKKIFISNKELSRGDIVLNCDGMRYSEKSNYSV